MRAAARELLVQSLWLVVLYLAIGSGMFANGAETHSENFTIIGQNQELTDNMSRYCEQLYVQHWHDWFGCEPRRMPKPAPIEVVPGRADQTSYGSTGLFVDNGVFLGADGRWTVSPGWSNDMAPHEVMHIVLCYGLGWNAPRWLDEGIASNCENAQGQANWYDAARQVVSRGQQLSLRQLTYKPVNNNAPSTVDYIQGCPMVSMLLEREGGRESLIQFARMLRDSNLDKACLVAYGTTPEQLDQDWAQWVRSHPGNASDRRVIGRTVFQFCPNGKCWIPSDSGWQPSHVVVTPQVTQPVKPPTAASFTDPCWVEWRNKIDAQIAAIKSCNCDHSNDITKADLEAAIAEIQLKPGPAGPPGPPGPPGEAGKPGEAPTIDTAGESHIVVVVDRNASWWPRLSEDIEKTRDSYNGIQISGLPKFPIGEIPQAVVYENSVPVRVVKGEREVLDLLSRVRRGAAI